MPAKKYGRKRWTHIADLQGELMACEAQLDSMQQILKPINIRVVYEEMSVYDGGVFIERLKKKNSKALGHIRSALAKVGYSQKCLSRFVHPAPNQRMKCADCGKRLILDYKKIPLPHNCKGESG